MDFENLFTSGYSIIFKNDMLLSFLRNSKSDFVFTAQERHLLKSDGPVDGEVELNYGDIFITAINIYKDLNNYETQRNTYIKKYQSNREDLIYKTRSCFSSNTSDELNIISASNTHEIISAKNQMYEQSLKLFFYDIFMDYLINEAKEEQYYVVRCLNKALSWCFEDCDIVTPEHIYTEIKRLPDLSFSITEVTIQFDLINGPRYFFSNLSDLIIFDLHEFLKKDISIKKCQNCGKYFIPTTRSDEKYCYYPIRDGKSCKDLGYANKLNSDIILKTYRSIYKTQNARKVRNKNGKDKKYQDEIDKRFTNWVKYAKCKLNECQVGKIDLETFKTLISTNEWISRKEGT